MLLNHFKIVAFCCFAVLSQIVFAQERPTDTNFIDARGLRQGPWKVIRSEGMSYTGQFKDNMPYGQFRYFDRFNRTITILDYFREGYAAKATHFYPNGRIRAIGFYLDQQRDSTWEIFDTVGRLIERVNYLDDRKHGLSEIFDRTGELIKTQEWYRGLRNGRWWQKDERGEQWTTYRFNKSHGVYEANFANGNPYIRGYYEEGLKEGIWHFYHDNGLLDRIMHFKNNRLVKRLVAINVRGEDILLNTDSVGYMHTNGRIVEIKMLDGTTYRPSQSFDQLVKSFDKDDFFLANSRFLAPFRQFDSLIMQPDEDDDEMNATTLRATTREFADEFERTEHLSRQRALLVLKIPMPYDVFVDGEVIGMLQSVMNFNPPVEED